MMLKEYDHEKLVNLDHLYKLMKKMKKKNAQKSIDYHRQNAKINRHNNKQVAQRATIAHLSPMCQGQISFQKIQTHSSFNACSCYMKVSKGSNQKQQRKSGNTIFPIIRSIGVFLRRSRAANSVVGGPFCQNSNSFIILCMFLLPASLKKIGSISTEIT